MSFANSGCAGCAVSVCWVCACVTIVTIATAGWLHGVFVGEWLFVFPLCGFSLSLFCNYPWECAHPQLRCP